MVDPVESAAMAAMGRVAALERVLGAVITTHPEPEKLLSLLTYAIPEWQDELARRYTRPGEHRLVQAAEKTMQRLKEGAQIAVAARAKPAQGPTSGH